MRASAAWSTVWGALGPIDVASIKRDSLLRWMVAAPVLIALVFRYGTPPVEVWLESRFGVPLAPHYPLLVSFLVMTMPMLFGAIIGFLLLDQKDDRTLTALQVTPLGTAGYLVYRLAMPLLLCVVMTVVALPLSGLSSVGFGGWLVAAVGAAPLAPAFALFVGSFAANKVQGFALMKAAGVVNWPPVIAWFVRSEWQWAFGLCPTFWAAKLTWLLETGEPGAVLALAAGYLYAAVLVVLFLRRFDRVMHR